MSPARVGLQFDPDASPLAIRVNLGHLTSRLIGCPASRGGRENAPISTESMDANRPTYD